MPTVELRFLAREIAGIAHGRAIHALGPLLAVCETDRRDAVERLMAREFAALDETLELVLTHRLGAARCVRYRTRARRG